MSQTGRAYVWAIRLKRFASGLVSSRMALIGVLLLSFFASIALAAPYLTPYPPQGEYVSTPFNPPTWISYFTGSRGWSQNIPFSPLSLRSVTPGLNIMVNSHDAKSIDFVATTQAGGVVQIAENVSYPFDGPPKDFSGSLIVHMNNLPAAVSANVFFDSYINGTKKWGPFWQQTFFPQTNYDTITSFQSQGVAEKLGYVSTSLSAAEIIFSRKANYFFILELAFAPGFNGHVSIQSFHMFLYGNTWGLLGTDESGFDVFTQVVWGARLSMIVGLTAAIIGITLGLLVGLIAGYLGKVVDEVLMRFTDMMLVIPGLPLLIVLVAVLGPNLYNIILVLGFLGWMGFARLIRAQVLTLRERPFIEAAKASGAGTGYILAKHIFSNIVSLTYVNLALAVPGAIVGEAALSFLGLGDESVVTWGRMLNLAQQAGTSSLTWWWVLPPGLGIALISLAFILLGFGLDAVFNPRLRARR